MRRMDAQKRFTTECIEQMRADVKEAEGNEVFWAGKVNPEGKVFHVELGTRGNIHSVAINPRAARAGDVLIHNHPTGNLTPSSADQGVAYEWANRSLGFYIVDNEVEDVYVVLEPVKPKKVILLEEGESEFLLSAAGPFARSSEGYEERPCQMELSGKIAQCFNEQLIGAFEAGTGVGKSFAYLIPSILWSTRNKERVVISTGTINLQQQLFDKDIPAAQKITGKKVKAVLLKGRRNYVCLRRLSEAKEEADLFSLEDAGLLEKIREWAKSSPEGSKSELTFIPPESVWSKVNSESDACLGGHCVYRESCFVMKLRKEAASSDIVVVNHHLLFADAESRLSGIGWDDASVLPAYRRVVFDEAHGIEDSATSFFSSTLTRFDVAKQLNLLAHFSRGKQTGVLARAQIAALLPDGTFENAIVLSGVVKTAAQALDDEALGVLGDSTSARLTEASEQRFLNVLRRLEKLRVALCTLLDDVREGIEKDEGDERAVDGSLWEAKSILRRLDEFSSLCESFQNWRESENHVFWFQKNSFQPKETGAKRTYFVQFMKTPLDISTLMCAGVLQPMKTALFTSATLTAGGSMDFWMKRVGITKEDSERVLQGSFASPFDFKHNVLLALPQDAPSPDRPGYQDFVEKASLKLILAAGGRTLLLFTSYESLKWTFKAISASLAKRGIAVLKQGDEERSRLLQRFKEDKGSVLFATDSFWAGIDVPGESLSQVIIAKLPFDVPTDPVFQARAEDIEKRGGNPFLQLSVPRALIKFRQGFGRLIRRKDDRGVVAVLDRRLVEKRYGKLFLQSLPETKLAHLPLEKLSGEVKRFLSE